MVYSVKEIFYTLQGEGANSGRPAVFCRFSGCNLWSGLERDRHQAICTFCDTDFVGVDGVNGGKYKSAKDLALKIRDIWDAPLEGKPMVVCTGGEPLLQLDKDLINALHKAGFEIAVETNGTLPASPSIDWVCISPKANAPLKQTSGNEIKLVYPQTENDPNQFEDLNFEHFYLQPKDDENQQENIKACVEYCKKHPRWKLSLQIHKILDIP